MAHLPLELLLELIGAELAEAIDRAETPAERFARAAGDLGFEPPPELKDYRVSEVSFDLPAHIMVRPGPHPRGRMQVRVGLPEVLNPPLRGSRGRVRLTITTEPRRYD